MFRQQGDRLFLECSILPKSKEEKIVGRFGDTLKIKLTAAPTDGKANKALIRFLAAECRLKPGAISISRGLASRRKTVCLAGVTSPPQCLLPFLEDELDQDGT